MSIKKTSPMSFFMFLIAAVFFFYEFALQVSPGIMTHSLMQSFGIDATTLGLISGAYYYSYTGMQIPMGLFFGRFGARRMIAIAALVCASGSLLFSIAPNVFTLGLGRFLMGLGSAFAFVGVLYISLRWFPMRYFAVMAGVTQTLGALGALSGQGPLGLLINHLGWRHTMMLFGFIGIGISIGVYLFLRDCPPHQQEKLAEEQKTPLWQALKRVLAQPQTWPVAIYSFGIWAPIIASAGLWGIPFLMAKYHISNVAAANAIAMVWIGNAAGSLAAGYISERIQRRCSVLAGVALIGVFATILIVYTPNLPMLLLYICLFLMGVASGGQSLAFAVITDNHSSHTSSAAMGFNNMAVVVGGAIFQPLLGKLLDTHFHGQIIRGVPNYSTGDYQFAFILLPLCFLVCAIVALLWIKETRCKITFNPMEEKTRLST